VVLNDYLRKFRIKLTVKKSNFEQVNYQFHCFKKGEIMKNPYAISDFEKLRKNGFHYIDRTDRIPNIENTGEYLLFLRPRRFGKSLLLSTLKNYYDMGKKDDFDTLFSDLWIGQHPTPLANQYFVLKWDFSCVKCHGTNTEIEKSLYTHVNDRIKRFASDYAHLLPMKIQINECDGISSFESLLTVIIRHLINYIFS